METYNIGKKDMHQYYFHFTQKENLKSIEKKGLIPKVGHNARWIEKSKKIFFVEGLDNFLILFDCWINCYKKIPVIPLIYNLGANLLNHKWFPKWIADGYFKFVDKRKWRKKRAYKMFDNLLESCVLLKLDLEEEIDFSKNDKDEIKTKGYYKEHLIIIGYLELYSDVNSTSMDKWNMHTLSNHRVDSSKIQLCLLNDSYKLKEIFHYILENTSLDIEKICPHLFEYLIYIKEKHP